MKNKLTPALLGIATFAALAAPAAMAQGTGWYGGGSVGSTRASIDDPRITRGLASEGLTTRSIDDRERDTGGKLFGGYQLTPNIGLEAGYFDLGKFGYTARTTPSGSLTGDIRVKGLNLDLVGTLPVTERFSLLARVGAISERTVGDFSATGAARVPYATSHTSHRSTDLKIGVGVAYAFTDSLSGRLEAERYRIKDSVGNRGDVDMVSVGLVYRFGTAPATRSVAAAQPALLPMPAPAAPASPPTPVVMPAPVPAAEPAVTRVNFSADSLFGFDSAVLSTQGKTVLDKLAGDLRGVRYDAIHVTGHTDRLGAAAYNDALSTRRAKAVSDYLVASGEIDRRKVTARGAGAASPITSTSDCRGTAQTPALIKCLQPDRRVEVEVHGTR